jgi:hypothetical protein
MKIQPMVEGPNFNKPQAPSNKRAASLTMTEGYYRINLERRNI